MTKRLNHLLRAPHYFAQQDIHNNQQVHVTLGRDSALEMKPINL